jgi:hypothetical protein
MRWRDVPGWLEALPAARNIWPQVPAEVWEAAGEREAREGTLWVTGPNECYVVACEAGLVPGKRRG